MKTHRVVLKPAQCAVDLGDGSERGLYVCQDYILQKLGRPHRAINLMYCYYPFDREWPARISEAAKPDGSSQDAWQYPYDDYFPFHGEEVFSQMRDIRRHGQDVLLTLTCDPAVTDEMIGEIAEKLRPFGRMMLRLNHEAAGTWFAFNKRNTYQEVADFFVRFHRILKRIAPNVKIILCAGAATDPDDVLDREAEFLEASRDTDIWAEDEYLSLNWGWPFEVAEKDNTAHKTSPVDDIFEKIHRTYNRYCLLNGGTAKPMQVAEFNDDGDVLGAQAQARRIRRFYDLVEEKGSWLSAITMYQFRDDGRLGLEVTDPNCPEVGIPQPELQTYREVIRRPYFSPVLEQAEGGQTMPVSMRWGGAEDAEGIAMELPMEGNPVFAEAVFGDALKPLAMMMEIRSRWFAKMPGVSRVDLMPAFWENPLSGAETVSLNLFVTPEDGENRQDGTGDWDVNYRCVLPELPELRIRFEGCLPEP